MVKRCLLVYSPSFQTVDKQTKSKRILLEHLMSFVEIPCDYFMKKKN